MLMMAIEREAFRPATFFFPGTFNHASTHSTSSLSSPLPSRLPSLHHTHAQKKHSQEILRHVRALAAAAKSDASGGPSSSNALSLSDLALPSACREVVDKDASDVLDEVRRELHGNERVELEFPARGGHVGFTSGRRPWKPWYYGEWRAAEFLSARLERFARALR